MYHENNITKIWYLVKDELKKSFSDASYSLWFEKLNLVSLDEEKAVISTDDKYNYSVLNRRYIDIVKQKFEDIMGFDIDVEIIYVEPKEKKPLEGESAPVKSKKEEHSYDDDVTTRTEDFQNRNEYTFENFIVGNSNKFAYSACMAVASTPGSVYNPLFIYGPSGLGKTHLMYAVTNEIFKKNPKANLVYIKCEEFTTQLIDAIMKQHTPEFREKFRRADILLIDDIQFIAGKESTQEELFHTFNELYEDHKQIILTCDRPAKDIKLLEDRLKTRFEWGLIADIQPPDLELRAAIIKKKAGALGIELKTDVISYLAEKLKSNVRQIEGALKRLSAMSFLSGERITVDMAARTLADMISEDIPLSMKINRIIYTVAEKYGVDVDDLKGKKRTKEIAWARHVAIYIMREKTDMSLPAIGTEFGRDHTTVLSSHKIIEKEISENPSFAVEINELINEIDI